MSWRPFFGLAQGCTRLVLLVGPWAFKLPNMLHGWRDALFGLIGNMKEAELAAKGRPELCPVLWRIPGGFLVVMRRARVMSEREFAGFDPVALCDHPAEGRWIPAQWKPDSFGWLDGRPVCVDYGA